MPNTTVCISVDWEGQNLDGVPALEIFNDQFPKIPITHFVSAAYLSRDRQTDHAPADFDAIVARMTRAIKQTDEVALHLHCWRSLYNYGNVGTQFLSAPVNTPWECDYAGQHYTDTGYVIDPTSLSSANINMLFDNSLVKMARLLKALKKRHQREYSIAGFRSGGWLADNNVFDILKSKRLVYDASAVPYGCRRRADPEYVDDLIPMVNRIAKLWGPELTVSNSQNWWATLGSGVDHTTGPYKIGDLIELPNNGMLMSAVSAAAVRAFLDWSLKQPVNRYLSIGFHQESAGGYITDFYRGRIALLATSADPLAHACRIRTGAHRRTAAGFCGSAADERHRGVGVTFKHAMRP